MCKFVLEKIIFTKKDLEEISFYKLVINDKCEYDKFYKQTFKSNQKLQLIQILKNLRLISEGKSDLLPRNKFRVLKRNKNDKVIDYELKTNNLRLYFFRDEGSNRVIVIGGKKTTQTKDLLKFRKIKLEYITDKSK